VKTIPVPGLVAVIISVSPAQRIRLPPRETEVTGSFTVTWFVRLAFVQPEADAVKEYIPLWVTSAEGRFTTAPVPLNPKGPDHE
jgi:hypothetical protein